MINLRIASATLASLVVSCASPSSTGGPEPVNESRVSPYLMFQDGRAEEAMAFYVSLFEGAKVLRADKFGAGQPAPEGSLMVGIFEIAGQRVMCTESPAIHDFGFTPSVSLFVDCEDAAEIERLVEELSDGGSTMMPLGDYGFSEKFAWIEDRYGVSWQLNLDLH